MTPREQKAQAAAAAYRIGGLDALMAMGVTNPKLPGARWEDEAVAAAIINGWEIVEANGLSDYQGWGRLLLTDGGHQWATLGWSYGSCSGCDSYEDMDTAAVVESLAGDIDIHPDEATARLKYAEGNW